MQLKFQEQTDVSVTRLVDIDKFLCSSRSPALCQLNRCLRFLTASGDFARSNCYLEILSVTSVQYIL